MRRLLWVQGYLRLLPLCFLFPSFHWSLSSYLAFLFDSILLVVLYVSVWIMKKDIAVEISYTFWLFFGARFGGSYFLGEMLYLFCAFWFFARSHTYFALLVMFVCQLVILMPVLMVDPSPSLLCPRPFLAALVFSGFRCLSFSNGFLTCLIVFVVVLSWRSLCSWSYIAEMSGVIYTILYGSLCLNSYLRPCLHPFINFLVSYVVLAGVSWRLDLRFSTVARFFFFFPAPIRLSHSS